MKNINKNSLEELKEYRRISFNRFVRGNCNINNKNGNLKVSKFRGYTINGIVYTLTQVTTHSGSGRQVHQVGV